VAPGWLDGREVLAFFRELGDARPSYFIEVANRDASQFRSAQ